MMRCGCAGGSCAVREGRRACSCGCVVQAEAQPVKALSAMGGTECVGGKAGPYPCRDIDLAAFLPLADIGGGSANEIWGWTDALTGREYALIGRSTGLSFVDVTIPDAPVYLGSLPAHTAASPWRDVDVYANFAFVGSEAADHGMQVFDLTRLRNVENRPATFTEDAHYNGFGSSHTLTINQATGFAFAVGSRTCAGGLHMVNIQNPRSPTYAGCFAADGYTHETQCVIYRGPDERYRSREVCFASNEDTLTIVDVTDKTAPIQVSRTPYDGQAYTHQGWLTDDQTYFLADDEGDERLFKVKTRTYVWNVSNLEAPRVTATHEGRTRAIDHNQYVRGNFVYQANYRAGLSILDITGIAGGSLEERAFFDTYPEDDEPLFNSAWGLYPYFASGTIVVSGIEEGLFVLRPRIAPDRGPAGVSLEIGDSPDPAQVGSNLTYVATIANAGPAAAQTVRFVTSTPEGTAFQSVQSTTGGCVVESTIACEIGTLPAGASVVVTVVVRPTRAGTVTASATVAAQEPDANPADNTATAMSTVTEPKPASLRVVSPNGGEAITANRQAGVHWTFIGGSGDVRVELSRDGGTTWTTLFAQVPNTGVQTWMVTGPTTTRARIRVTSLNDPEVTDQSDENFIIR